MTSWSEVVKTKKLITKNKRVITNFHKYFATDFLYTFELDSEDIRIQTNNVAMVNYFFDIDDYYPTDNKSVWIYDDEDKYFPTVYNNNYNNKNESNKFTTNPVRQGFSFLNALKS